MSFLREQELVKKEAINFHSRERAVVFLVLGENALK